MVAGICSTGGAWPQSHVIGAIVRTGATLPGWLQHVAIWNPFSSTVQAARELFGNPVLATGHSFPVEHPILVSVGWALLLLAVFIPLSVRKYARVGG